MKTFGTALLAVAIFGGSFLWWRADYRECRQDHHSVRYCISRR